MSYTTDTKQPKVIVARPIPQHSQRLAVAAQKAGLLKAYYTGFYTDWTHYPFSLLRWLPISMRKYIETRIFAKYKRSHPELLSEKVTVINPTTWIALAIAFRSGMQEPWNKPIFHLANRRFQQHIARISMKQADILVLYDHAAYYALDTINTQKRTKNTSLITILDLATIGWGARDRITREESAKWPEFHTTRFPSDTGHIYNKVLKEPHLADYILAGSNWVKSTCIESGVAPCKIHVVNYGVDLRIFHPIDAPKPDSPLKILYASAPSVLKGYPYFLEALKELRDLDIEIVLCSDGDFGILDRLDLGNIKLTHKGFLPHSELAKVMRDVDVYCHPSVVEGFSLTCLEAMASGLSVILTPRSGTSEIVTDGIDGFIVPVGDGSSIAKGIRRLYTDRDLLRRVGSAARRTSEKYSWEYYEKEIANKLISIFNEKGNERASI